VERRLSFDESSFAGNKGVSEEDKRLIEEGRGGGKTALESVRASMVRKEEE
jgi:hypothetical protein